MLPPVLISSVLPKPAMEEAQRRFDVRLAADSATDAAALMRVAGEHHARALVISSRSKVTAAVLADLPATVRVIATTSVGYDHIDLAAARAAGVIVTNTPDVVTAATADLTLFLILGALRRGREYQQIIEAGWRRAFNFDEMLGLDLGVRALAIVGMGRIGQAVAHRAKAFGMTIRYHNRNRLPPELEAGAVYHDSLEDLLPHAQVLCLTAPPVGAGPLITADRIARLPAGAVLINTGRGALVDEEAMIAALACGRLGAAGLDVFKSEPAYDLRLRDLPNVFMTPHMGSATLETRVAMSLRAIDNVSAVLAGRPPRDALTA